MDLISQSNFEKTELLIVYDFTILHDVKKVCDKYLNKYFYLFFDFVKQFVKIKIQNSNISSHK